MEYNLDILQRLEEERFNLSHLLLLKYISQGVDIKEMRNSSVYNTLLRKEMVISGLITELGLQFLEKFDLEKQNEEVISNPDTKFDEFWKLYPQTDIVKDNNGKVIFSVSRSLKSGKKLALVKYKSILKDYKHEDIIRSLKYELDLKRRQSIKENTNKLSFMKNIQTWLNQREFESYLEISSEDIESHNQTQNNNIQDIVIIQ